MIESIYVGSLFLLFTLMWEIKRRHQKKMTGIDPDVFGRARSPLQRYMNGIQVAMTVCIVILIVLHGAGVQWGAAFSRSAALDRTCWDHAGFILGIAGLGLCGWAQIIMGESWRVGIDENQPTELVTGGVFSHIRNPTYLGIFMLIAGVWIVWPTWTIAMFDLAFLLFLEIQVRCEEEHLLRRHGGAYEEYLARTKRYIPWLY